MVSKEVVEEGDYAVFPFTYIHSLVHKVVDLFNIEYTIIHCQFPEILLNMAVLHLRGGQGGHWPPLS